MTYEVGASRSSTTVQVICNAGNLMKCYIKNTWYPFAKILHLKYNNKQTLHVCNIT